MLEDRTSNQSYYCVSSMPEQTIILIGWPGSGKSATGNTIVGSDVFESYVSQELVTKKIEKQPVEIHGKQVTIVDTPGLQTFDDFLAIYKESEPNAVYAIVIRIGRSSSHEVALLFKILESKKISQKNTFVVFSARGEIDRSKNKNITTIQDWLNKSPKLLELINTYKLQYTTFENEAVDCTEKLRQVEELFSLISDIEKKCTATGMEPPTKRSDRRNKPCPVSCNTISVTRNEMKENFGTYGEHFFDEKSKPKNEQLESGFRT